MIAALLFSIQASIAVPTDIRDETDPNPISNLDHLGSRSRMRSDGDNVSCTFMAWDDRRYGLIGACSESDRDVSVTDTGIDDPDERLAGGERRSVWRVYVFGRRVVALVSARVDVRHLRAQPHNVFRHCRSMCLGDRFDALK